MYKLLQCVCNVLLGGYKKMCECVCVQIVD